MINIDVSVCIIDSNNTIPITPPVYIINTNVNKDETSQASTSTSSTPTPSAAITTPSTPSAVNISKYKCCRLPIVHSLPDAKRAPTCAMKQHGTRGDMQKDCSCRLTWYSIWSNISPCRSTRRARSMNILCNSRMDASNRRTSWYVPFTSSSTEKGQTPPGEATNSAGNNQPIELLYIPCIWCWMYMV